MKTSWRNASLVASAAAVLVLTTACGQEGGTSSVGSQNVGATAAAGGYGGVGSGIGTGTSPSASSTVGGGQGNLGAQSASAGKLEVSANAELGDVLTDSAGLSLYRFDEDTAEPPKSNCNGDCATAWPPVPANDASAGAGIDKALLGEVTRADGSKQLTIGGWPAYRYAKDTKAGDLTGQGVGGKWYALAPTGKKASVAGLPGLSTRNDPNLGEIVVDKNGMTVYRFAKDKAWPEPVSNCNGACLEKWPVVAPVSANDTKDVQKKGLMSFTRSDGAKQQTVNCSPIYTFAGDKKAGDTNGQGVGGTWYAVRPNGEMVGVSDK
ncbi:putative lipoprotein with Yx(FWY)xxD motif [Streptomyces sp. SAI-144]|uniref:SCO0930 family lipoprotein n=1 Tax=unclassified Streptomyces TaxID=2593676 RepID=UPI002474D728|nr:MULTISPECIES: SCO0930 family lipoprotein [unclassified Streptomyces]MDH6438118.1 putative lipoprotein with Yx(FWY)xxD motif [Streptomyces sp. SAI-144]MDH6485537.1 putative lipoprotein with Yx(FWY)xxD motif [Streptomyces sp. SAI-127]